MRHTWSGSTFTFADLIYGDAGKQFSARMSEEKYKMTDEITNGDEITNSASGEPLLVAAQGFLPEEFVSKRPPPSPKPAYVYQPSSRSSDTSGDATESGAAPIRQPPSPRPSSANRPPSHSSSNRPPSHSSANRPPSHSSSNRPSSHSSAKPGVTNNKAETSAMVIHQPMVVVPGDAYPYRRDPVLVVCQHCQATVSTSITRERSLLQKLLAVILCCYGCWCGCCLIPLHINDLKDVSHSCPNCKNEVGKFLQME